MKIRYAVGLIFAAVMLVLVPSRQQLAFAQSGKEPAGFKNVTLLIYPEYDDPRLLVMLEGKISAAEVPSEVRFLVPEAAQMFSAGAKDATGKYTGGPPNRIPSKIPGWDEISYTLKTDTFRVEYYDPIIAGNPDKKISYDFRWLYPITDLGVIVQVPRKASNFIVTPTGRTGTDGEGFDIYSYGYRDLSTTAPPLHFDIVYNKSDPSPSLKTGGGGSSTSSGLLIGLAVGVILAGAAIWFFMPRRKPAYAAKSAARVGHTKAARRRIAGRKLCSRCGKPVEGSPKFCPHCGNKMV